MATKRQSNGAPEISQVSPPAAIPGGEIRIRGKGFARNTRPSVMPAALVQASTADLTHDGIGIVRT